MKLGLFYSRYCIYIYLDTGAIYRTLTLKALDRNINLNDKADLIKMCKKTKLDIGNNDDGSIKVILDGRDVSHKIRSPRITQYVSSVAKIEGIRKQMLRLQRRIGMQNNIVIEGRDIGTVVFPNADKKFYLDAKFNERVKRRYKELKATNNRITKKLVELDLKNRDRIDSTRKCAPLKKAKDAIYIDTTDMTIKQAVGALLRTINNG